MHNGGGTALQISIYIPYGKALDCIVEKSIEKTTGGGETELQNENNKITIITVYKSPNGKLDTFFHTYKKSYSNKDTRVEVSY